MDQMSHCGPFQAELEVPLRVCDAAPAPAPVAAGRGTKAARNGSGGGRRPGDSTGGRTGAAGRGRARLFPDRHFRCGTSAGGTVRARAPWEAAGRRVIHAHTHILSVLGGWSIVAFVEPKGIDFQDKKDKKLGKRK